MKGYSSTSSSSSSSGRKPMRSLVLWAGAAAAAALLSNNCCLVSLSPSSHGAQLGTQRGRAAKQLRPTQAAQAGSGVDPRLNAKAELCSLLDDPEIQREVLRADGKAMRGRIDEAIVQLERLSPIDEPAYSELFDGRWVVKYYGGYSPGVLSLPTRELALFLYGGFSIGSAISSFVDGFWGKMLGMQMGPKTVVIKDGRDAEASAELMLPGGIKETLGYTAELMPLSARRFNEEVKTFDLPSPFGTQDAPLEIQRNILVTYLDDKIMVVRDESGVPEVLERVGPVGTDDVPAEGNGYAAPSDGPVQPEYNM